jgi:hypothetical protein
MKKFFYRMLIAAAYCLPAAAQEPVDSVKFFLDETIIDVTLEMDLKDLLGKKQNERFLPAAITMAFKDGTVITEGIRVSVRGNFRKETCYMPGLKLDFHNPTSPKLYKLDELKMVCGCSGGGDNEQLVIKEYLVYKLYNALTPKSLNVRPMKITFKDAARKRKPYTQFGFLIEDIDNMARRNNMIEVEGTVFNTELTDRAQMTMVALFQYMIGNTDWSVPNYHNVKLIGPKGDNTTRPLVVPYDFDICGFVDPPYATIDEQLQSSISSVRERLYRGFPRSMEELKAATQIFLDNKSQLYALISNNEWLTPKEKGKCTSYLDEFYKIISSDRDIQRAFIEGARRQ